jgi:nucleoid-associated protein YgaU
MAGPDFGKMIGPLPLGAWLAVTAGGVGIVMWQRRSGGAEVPQEPQDDTSGVPGVGDGSVGGWSPTGPVGSSTPGDTTPVLNITDNDSWAKVAANWLISQGYDATVSASAISKYTSAEPMSVTEYVLVGRALAHFGVPPTPLPAPIQVPTTAPPIVKPPVKPPVVKPPPPKPQPTKPVPGKPAPHYRYYVVRKGDNLSKIAKAYHTNWQTLYNLNRAGKRRKDGKLGMIVNPNLIRPGWQIILP